MSIKITIDTNLINVNNKLESVNKLEEFNKLGVIEIVGTERLLMEQISHKEGTIKAKGYSNISEPGVLGASRVGKCYAVNSAVNRCSFDELAKILFPNENNLDDNKVNDVMHLLAHSYSDSNYFVTNNSRDFIDAKKTNINRRQDLKEVTRKKLQDLSIYVLRPEEMVELINKELSEIQESKSR